MPDTDAVCAVELTLEQVNGTTHHMPRGKMLGGSSAQNYMMFGHTFPYRFSSLIGLGMSVVRIKTMTTGQNSPKIQAGPQLT